MSEFSQNSGPAALQQRSRLIFAASGYRALARWVGGGGYVVLMYQVLLCTSKDVHGWWNDVYM